jgi:ketosteroid isomerase-like protein
VLAPSGRRIRQHAVEIVRARGGRIERWTTYVDLLPMMLELGIVTPAALPAR